MRKKNAALILAAGLMLMLAACGGKNAASAADDDKEASESSTDMASGTEDDTGKKAMVPLEEDVPEKTEALSPAPEAYEEQPEEEPETDTVSENTEEEPMDTEDSTDTEASESSPDEGTFTSSPIPDEVFSRMSGVSFPADCTISREDLRYLRLSYHDFNGDTQLGELVCNKKVADDMVEIFRELYARGYQIDKMKLIDDYGGDDDLSCADDNTSCFNYRTVAGSTNLSKHAMGVAIDINPFYNPYVTYPGGVERISPPGSEPYADRSADFPHKIGPGDDAYELFKSHGFTWGGNWKTLKDYQHFQKP